MPPALCCRRMAVTVKLLAFAGARDVVGAAELDHEIAEPVTAGDLLADVCRRFPGLAPYRASLRVAVNGRYAVPHDRVCEGDEVALIPPVAGG